MRAKGHNVYTLVRGLLAAVFLMLLLFSCGDDQVCEDVTANDLRIGFYETGEGGQAWTVIDSLREGSPDRPDEDIFEKIYSVSSLELPLNPSEDTSRFLLDFFTHTDTMTVSYRREKQLISVECGFTMFFEITGVSHTSNRITSISIPVDYVTNNLDEHFKVYITVTGDNGL